MKGTSILKMHFGRTEGGNGDLVTDTLTIPPYHQVLMTLHTLQSFKKQPRSKNIQVAVKLRVAFIVLSFLKSEGPSMRMSL